ncbi:GNAT family N-acetyltransferase [Streptomyces sp. WAC 00631]|nr:GNAT family N-acetyltransferase [Streptomyces sp. WAC 00631]MCC5031789.1 GNAT family N-acetyltransferase [Streptomyces sp. WAC 00631]
MRWWDIPAVLDLEREMFPEDAWTAGMFWSELAHARGRDASRRYLVAEETGRDGEPGGSAGPGGTGEPGSTARPGAPAATGRIVGYGGLAASGGTGDVQTIAVTRSHWGTGLGARLLAELLAAAWAFACEEVLLEVRVDNTRAQRLYERFGFRPIGIRRGYYQPGNVDAVVMRRTAPGPAAPDAPAPGRAPGSVSETAPEPEPEPEPEPTAGRATTAGTRHTPAADPDEQGTTIHG